MFKETLLKRTIREILLNDGNISIEEFNKFKKEGSQLTTNCSQLKLK